MASWLNETKADVQGLLDIACDEARHDEARQSLLSIQQAAVKRWPAVDTLQRLAEDFTEQRKVHNAPIISSHVLLYDQDMCTLLHMLPVGLCKLMFIYKIIVRSSDPKEYSPLYMPMTFKSMVTHSYNYTQ